jgi:8-oxo-dGTP pyrophosphatase MutT (NUDIX family)
MTQESPIVRPAARVILFDYADRVLLFRAVTPDAPDRPFWITPGGGIEPGETAVEAARRELREETGLVDVEVGPCVWVRRHVVQFGRTWIDARESYFFVRAPAFEVSTDAHTDVERRFLTEHRWWELAEIATSPERFVPRDFAALARPLAEGRFPLEPIVVGV